MRKGEGNVTYAYKSTTDLYLISVFKGKINCEPRIMDTVVYIRVPTRQIKDFLLAIFAANKQIFGHT
jgi:hypothetical protein